MTLINGKSNKYLSALIPSFPKGSLFSNLEFINLWGAQVLTQTGVRLFDFVLAIQIFKATGSNASVSYLIFVYGLPALFFSSLAGVLVDRWNKKGTLILINLARALIIIGFIFISKSFPVIILFAFLLSLVTQFFIPIEGSLIPQIVDKKNLLTANSIFSLTFYSSSVVGFMLAGPLIKSLGDMGAYIFISLMFAASVFLVSLLPNLENKRLFPSFSRKNKISYKDTYMDLVDGFNLIRKTKVLRKSIFYMALSQIVVSMFMALMPGFAVSNLGLSAEDSSLYLIGPAALGIILGALFVIQLGKKISKDRLVRFGLLGGSISLIALSFIPEINQSFISHGFDFSFPIEQVFSGERAVTSLIVLAFIFSAVSGFTDSFVIIPSTTLLQENSNKKNRGRVYGFLQTAVTAGGSIPIVLAGISADYLGINLVFRVMGFVLFIVFALSFIEYVKRD